MKLSHTGIWIGIFSFRKGHRRDVMRFALLLMVCHLIGCTNNSSPGSNGSSSSPSDGEFVDDKAIIAFCADCHQPPNPEYFSKADWPKEVYRGFRFHIDAVRNKSVSPPSVDKTVEYFVSRAPMTLPQPMAIHFSAEETPRFQASKVIIPQLRGAAVSFLLWQSRSADSSPALMFSDMLGGSVKSWTPGALNFETVSNTPHPGGLELCDLDSDGLMDLVVSDLGSFQPEDNSKGQIVWLRRLDENSFEEIVIAKGLGRVSESRAADFNGDGLLDLVVAEFGWLRTGHVLLYLQERGVDGARSFVKRIVDERHGAIRVPPVDLDGNGTMDFVANITQEHEVIEGFLNSGDAQFNSVALSNQRDPAYGSCGLLAVDLDQDGDMDFLDSNGDMFDSFAVKHYQGLRWLENLGALKFKEHDILMMPGIHGIATGDLDGDGDLDIVASALFPYRTFREMESSRGDVISAVWLEQTTSGVFVPHLVERGAPWHACVVLGDIDNDKDLDIVLGDFTPIETESRSPFVIYENTLSSRENANQ